MLRIILMEKSNNNIKYIRYNINITKRNKRKSFNVRLYVKLYIRNI